VSTGIAAPHRGNGIGRARERLVGEVGGMGIADRLAFDGAQPEALGGVEGRLLEPAVVEHQRLALPILEIELTVVGPGKAVRQVALHAGAIEIGAVDERIERWIGGEVSHGGNIGDDTPHREGHRRQRTDDRGQIESALPERVPSSVLCRLSSGYGSLSKPSPKPLRLTGMPMPSSGVWKMMKVADWPVRSLFIRSSLTTTSATQPSGRERTKETLPTSAESMRSPSPLGSSTPSGASTRMRRNFWSAVLSTITVRPTLGRSSAVTLWMSAHCSLWAPGGVSQRICQSPCTDLTTPWAAALPAITASMMSASASRAKPARPAPCSRLIRAQWLIFLGESLDRYRSRRLPCMPALRSQA